MKKIMYLLCLCSITNYSCQKFLDKKPDDNLTTPNNLFALQAVLDNGQYMNGSSPASGEASADDYYLVQSTYDTRSPVFQSVYRWELAGRSDYTFNNLKDWANLYFSVYNANVCLTGIDKIPNEANVADEWNNIKGSALFFRGWSFLQLAWTYCNAYDKSTASQDPGIALRTTDNFNVPSIRSGLSETYEQIIKDLKSALAYLSENVSIPLRPSKAAAYGYLARTYWSMREYDSAYRYADECLKIKSSLIDYNDGNKVKKNNSFPFSIFNDEVIHECYSSPTINIIAQSRALIDTNLFNSYNEHDLRKQAFFREGTDGMLFKGSYNGRSSWFTGVTTAEMYLIKAECLARTGQKEAAMDMLNAVLIKRWESGTFEPLVAENDQSALNLILAERRKELVFRDLRWIDIKRLNKEGAGISIKRMIDGKELVLQPNSNRFAIPLPTDIISLSGVQQNPQ